MSTGADAARPSRWSIAVGFVLGQIGVLALLLGPVSGQRWWTGMRDYFPYDQLGYLAIATNVANGQSPFVEPFTLTGSNYYPSLWFTIMGLLARVTGLPVHLLWTAMGLSAILATVALVGWLAVRYSRRWYAPVIPALLLATGLLTLPTFAGWATALDSRAIIWGPYGTLFPLNAEVAGLCAATLIVVLLLLAWPVATTVAVPTDRRRTVLLLVAAALLGLLANLHTYSFFSATIVAALFIGIRSLLRWPSRRRLLVTVILVGIVLIAGNVLSSAIGPLPLFVVLLAALAPAAWPLARRYPWHTTAAVLLVGLLASPQVVRTLVGLADGDPFLTFRQAMPAMSGLSVPLGTALLAAAPLLLLGLVAAILAARRREHTVLALVIALGSGWLLMSQNDLWGFNQEPYRFWLQFDVLSALLLGPALAWSIAHRESVDGRSTLPLRILTVAGAAFWVVGLAVLPSFWSFASQPTIELTGPRADAIRTLAPQDSGLGIGSACIRPQAVKSIAGGPVAVYGREFAWPADTAAIDALPTMDESLPLTLDALQRAGVAYVLTDSACADEWPSLDRTGLTVDTTATYLQDGATQTITRWRVP